MLVLWMVLLLPVFMMTEFLSGIPGGIAVFAVIMAASLMTALLKLVMASVRGIRGGRSMKLVFLAHMSSVPVGLLVAAAAWVGMYAMCVQIRAHGLPKAMVAVAVAVTAAGFAWSVRMERLYYRKYTNMEGSDLFVTCADIACYLAVVAAAVLVWGILT